MICIFKYIRKESARTEVRMKVCHYTLYPILDLSRKSKQDLDLRFLGKDTPALVWATQRLRQTMLAHPVKFFLETLFFSFLLRKQHWLEELLSGNFFCQNSQIHSMILKASIPAMTTDVRPQSVTALGQMLHHNPPRQSHPTHSSRCSNKVGSGSHQPDISMWLGAPRQRGWI